MLHVTPQWRFSGFEVLAAEVWIWSTLDIPLEDRALTRRIANDKVP